MITITDAQGVALELDRLRKELIGYNAAQVTEMKRLLMSPGLTQEVLDLVGSGAAEHLGMLQSLQALVEAAAPGSLAGMPDGFSLNEDGTVTYAPPLYAQELGS